MNVTLKGTTGLLTLLLLIAYYGVQLNVNVKTMNEDTSSLTKPMLQFTTVMTSLLLAFVVFVTGKAVLDMTSY